MLVNIIIIKLIIYNYI